MRDGKLVGSSDVRTSTPDDVIMMMSGKVLSQPMGGGRTRRDKAKVFLFWSWSISRTADSSRI